MSPLNSDSKHMWNFIFLHDYSYFFRQTLYNTAILICDTVIPVYYDTAIPVYYDTAIPVYYDTAIPVYYDTAIPVYHDTAIPVY